MAINAKHVKHKTNYSNLRHEEVTEKELVQEEVKATPKAHTKHAPVLDHIRMRKKLSAHKTSKYAEDLLNI